MDTNDAYRVLGLSPGASEDEVKAAYRALAQQYAPEAKPEGPERKEAEARMAELNEAFDTLIRVLRTGVKNLFRVSRRFRQCRWRAGPAGRHDGRRKRRRVEFFDGQRLLLQGLAGRGHALF